MTTGKVLLIETLTDLFPATFLKILRGILVIQLFNCFVVELSADPI